MIQRIATATIIRGYGECHEYIEGMEQAIIEQINAQHRQEINALKGRLSAAEAHRNGLLGKRLTSILRSRKSPMRRLCDRIAIAWAILYWYAIEAWRKFLEQGERWGLWFYEPEEGDK